MKPLIRLKKSCVFLTFLAFLVYSCSNPVEKTEKIISNLPDNSGVISANLVGEQKELVTYSLNPDSTVAVVLHSLKDGTSDTIETYGKDHSVCEVLPVSDGYLVVTRVLRSDGNYHYLYFADIVRNYKDSKAKTVQKLFVDEDVKELAASNYAVDKDAKTLTLSSYVLDDTKASIYHTVYDFGGNRIVYDPASVTMRQPQVVQVTQPRRDPVYLWQCNKCGKRATAKYKPTSWDTGSCYSHDWVQISRIE